MKKRWFASFYCFLLFLMLVCGVGAVQREVFYDFPLDSDPGWTTEGLWQFGAPLGGGSYLSDPITAHSGPNVYGYNLAGDYENNMPVRYLTTTALDCSKHRNITLSFWRWLSIEAYPFDNADIQISTDSRSWTTIWQHTRGTVTDTSWNEWDFDLSPYANAQPIVYIRWDMGPTDWSITYGGWNIDDVQLTGDIIDDLETTPSRRFVSSGYVGGPFSPPGKAYLLTNIGKAPIEWKAAKTQDWLEVSPNGGSLAPGESTTATLSIGAQADLLTTGSYADAVSFIDLKSGDVQPREVLLSVLPIPGRIDVTDSAAPYDDHAIPFGHVIVGQSNLATIIVTNTDPVHDLILTYVSFGRYEEDFDGDEATGWGATPPGQWEVVSGEYRAIGVTGKSSQSLYAGKTWDNCHAQVDVRRKGSNFSSVGLFSRASEDFNWDTGTGSAYAVGITGYSEFWVGKWVDGGFTLLQEWKYSPLLQTRESTNTIALETHATSLSVYFNGQLAWSALDDGVSIPGGIGLLAYGGDTTATDYFFDNVEVGDPISTGVPAPAYGTAAPAPTIANGSRHFRSSGKPLLPVALSPGGALSFGVICQPLAFGAQGTSAVIESNDANAPLVEVALNGTGTPDYLEIVPSDAFESKGHPGGPFSPPLKTYQLKNNSPIPVEWSVAADVDWLDFSTTAGILPPGASAIVSVSFNDSARNLPVGAHAATLTFSDLTTRFTQTRDVRLTVFTKPRIVVTPDSLNVTLLQGGATSETLTVANAADADANLDFTMRACETSRDESAGPVGPVGPVRPIGPLGPGGHLVAPGAPYKPGELLVRFKRKGSTGEREKILRSLSTAAAAAAGRPAPGQPSIVRLYETVSGLCRVKLPAGTTVEQALADFNGSDEILYAEPNYLLKAATRIPNDPDFRLLWAMRNAGQTGGSPGADIHATDAWEFATGSRDVVVAVIDTGVDYTHPDLAANMWINPGEIPGNDVDDDGNGSIDDVFGYDFLNGDGDPMDDNGHGTHVSGTIGADGDNGVGVAGVCWNVRIMALKFLGADGVGSTADAISCIDYGIRMGARLSNNSWGGAGYEQALKDAIDASGRANMLFVCAAGNDYGANNDATPYYPASFDSPNLIAVMSTDDRDAMSPFSNFGRASVDLAAPGSQILSCAPGGGYRYLSGTSMSTPHVAGACALLWSDNPALSAGQVKDTLLQSVDPLPAFAGRCVSGGRLNLFKALLGSGATWVAVAPGAAEGIVPGRAVAADVTFEAGSLAPGVYGAEIKILSNDADAPAIAVGTTMTILSDDLTVTPEGTVETTGMPKGPFAPTSHVYTLSNAGAAALDWTVSKSSDWLDIEGVSGSLSPGGSARVVATINAVASLLSVGTYSDNLAFTNARSGAVVQRKVVLAVLPPPLAPIVYFPLDSDPGWAREGQWEFGQPLGGGSHDGDPKSGHTGPNVFGYNLAGDYDNVMPVRCLTTPEFDCSGYERVTLRFWRWLGVENAPWDHATIQASNDGTNWTDIWTNDKGISDTSWTEVEYDLSAVADRQPKVYVRWGMGPTDATVTFCGWNIDDVALLGASLDALSISPADDFTASGLEGGPFAPSRKVYVLWNRGDAPLEWTAANAQPWVSVAPVGGSLAPGESAQLTVCLTAATADVSTGTHTDAIAIVNVASGARQTRSAILDVPRAPRKTIYDFPLDSDPRWSTQGQWEFGVPLGQGNFNRDPKSGYTGPNVYGYNLAGDYANKLPPQYLIAPPLDCSQYENVVLRFWRWLGVENSLNDHASVEASSDGVHWTTAWTHNRDNLADFAWTEVEYDLSAVADRQPAVFIRWVMGPTDGTVTFPGWNIDDIGLMGDRIDDFSISPSDDFRSSGRIGGPFSPSRRTYALANASPAAFDWQARIPDGGAAPWLSVAPRSGRLAAGASTTVTVALNVEAAAALTTGSCMAAIEFAREGSRFARTRGAVLEVKDAGEPGTLSNLATRGYVGAGDEALIAGFTIEGTDPRRVAVTAWGPSLAVFGVPGVLSDPALTVYSDQTPLVSNDNWGDSASRDDLIAAGMAPSSPLESGVVLTLQPGAYTVIVKGAHGETGIGLVAVWDLD